MRLSKLMLSAFVAVFAMVACNKEDSTPEAKRLRTVEVSLDNVMITRGLAGDKINSGDAVYVGDFKIFLTDASGNEYTAKVVDGSAPAQTYWSKEDLAGGFALKNAQFHYVDPNCSKVVAVANLGRDITFAEYKALAALKVEDQQDQKTLVLYDEKTLAPAGTQHNDAAADGTTYVADVYKADLVLKPRVSRFEVDGFTVRFNETPKYNEIKISQIAFQNYYPLTSVVTGAESGTIVNHIENLTNQAEVYTWLDDAAKPSVWYRDYFDLTITPEKNSADTPDNLAYHIFSCNETPVFVIKLLADGQPAYLYSKGFFKTEGNQIVEVKEFEEGKIYRMSAAGEVEKDGSIPIDEDDIDPMDRCLEITVDVVDWAVELVYPEF